MIAQPTRERGVKLSLLRQQYRPALFELYCVSFCHFRGEGSPGGVQ